MDRGVMLYVVCVYLVVGLIVLCLSVRRDKELARLIDVRHALSRKTNVIVGLVICLWPVVLFLLISGMLRQGGPAEDDPAGDRGSPSGR
jgi:hypothetical protein